MRNVALFAVWVVAFLVGLGLLLLGLAATVYQHFNVPAALIAGIVIGVIAGAVALLAASCVGGEL